MGTELRKLLLWVREGFTEEVTTEMVWETEEFIHWQARETEGKYKLSQGGRNPQCMFLRNRKCPFINS